MTASSSVTTNELVNALKVYGDQLDTIKLWIMHSNVYFDLVKEQIASNITNDSDFNIRNASPITLGIPVLVSDSPAPRNTSTSPITYYTLGVREGGLTLMQNQPEPIIDLDVIHGKENRVVDLQGEHEYAVRLQGYRYDVANGGVNPDDSTLATGTNWDKVATDAKSLAAAALSSV